MNSPAISVASRLRGNEQLWRLVADHGVAHQRHRATSGERLGRAGDPIERVHFPLDAIVLVARQSPLDPVPLTVGLIGGEGLVGIPHLLGVEHWSHDMIVLTGGELVSVAAADLAIACAATPPLRDLLLRVAHNYMLQLAQSVVANLGHSLERRLARWLVMLDDRSTGDMLAVTHEQLAQLLNVRRASVTDALHVLEGEQLVRSTRGRLQVRDRAALQARCGQSYGLSEDDYRVAIGPFGKSSAQQ